MTRVDQSRTGALSTNSMNPNKHLILHGFWRSSSTYFWSKFRDLPGALAYYEPFHGSLSGLVCDRSDSSLGWNSRHPPSINYFREIVEGYRSLGIDSYPQSHGEWDDREYFCLSQSHEMHVRRLCRVFEACHDKTICGWFFNRGVAKISSIHKLIQRETDSEVVSILLSRDPLQQYSSYAYQSSLHNLWFESRFFRQWLQGAIAPELVPWDLCSEGRIPCEIDQEILCDVMSSMVSRVNLSCYLYAFSTLKSLALSVGSWEPALGKEFDHRYHFLIDDFTRCGPGRESFVDLMKGFSPALDIADWRLPHQKNSIIADHLVSAFRCAWTSLQPLIFTMPTASVIKGFMKRICSYSNVYARMPSGPDFCPRLDAFDLAFMDSVRFEAEDFALLADNRSLTSQLKLIHDQKDRRVEELSRQLAKHRAQVQDLQKTCDEQAAQLRRAEEENARNMQVEQFNALEAEKANAVEAVEGLTQQLGLQSDQLQEALEARDQQAERVKTLEAEKADLARVIEDLRHQLALQCAQLQEMLEARDQQAEQLKVLESTKADADKIAAALQRLRQLSAPTTS